MSGFDTKEGIIGGPAWYREGAIRAQHHERYEDEQRRLADRRHQASRAATREARRELIGSIPTGSGQMAAEYVPWEHLWYYEGAWEMRPGAMIAAGAGELGDLARILGVRVTLEQVNGGRMEADPGDPAEVVMERYERAIGRAR